MADIEKHFRAFCEENGISPRLSFTMPEGYESAYGTFDVAVNTLFFNRELLRQSPDAEQLFCLYHELRHAVQYLRPEAFDARIAESLRYVISYDGTCYKLVEGEWQTCRLAGGEERFSALYVGQPYEADANAFAYAQVRALLGASPALDALRDLWLPKREIPAQTYAAVYAEIDATLAETSPREEAK